MVNNYFKSLINSCTSLLINVSIILIQQEVLDLLVNASIILGSEGVKINKSYSLKKVQSPD